MLEFILGLSTSFLAIAVMKSVVEPIAQRFGQSIIKKYAATAFDQLDTEWLPKHYQEGFDGAKSWLVETVLPQELPRQDLEKIADYVLDNFDLKTSLMKQIR